jgi:choline dehydrogenase-like flavoprotein
MRQYDIIIIGAATAGSFFARRMAERGHRVLIVEKLSRDKLGKRLDIFHVGKGDFARYGLPQPKQGDPDWAFAFDKNLAYSPTGKYPKKTH